MMPAVSAARLSWSSWPRLFLAKTQRRDTIQQGAFEKHQLTITIYAMMTTALQCYILGWSTACTAAMLILITKWHSFALSKNEYWQFLFARWRLTTFVVSASAMIVIAPWTGDPTWDYFNAFFMSVLAYATAPWATGTLYNSVRGNLKAWHGFVAACAWIFSASWSYDLYFLLKDGAYPIPWFSNLFASSVLYICAGLFWNLDWIEGRGVTFAFLEKNWPYISAEAVFHRIVLHALPFMLLVSFLIVYFFFYDN